MLHLIHFEYANWLVQSLILSLVLNRCLRQLRPMWTILNHMLCWTTLWTSTQFLSTLTWVTLITVCTFGNRTLKTNYNSPLLRFALSCSFWSEKSNYHTHFMSIKKKKKKPIPSIFFVHFSKEKKLTP